MTDRIRSRYTATLLVIAGTAAAADIDVMTQNQYLGTSPTPVITAPPAWLPSDCRSSRP